MRWNNSAGSFLTFTKPLLDSKEGEGEIERLGERIMRINRHTELEVFKKGCAVAMEIFHEIRGVPSEERYSLPAKKSSPDHPITSSTPFPRSS